MINELLMASRRCETDAAGAGGLIEDHRAIFAAIEQQEPVKARQAMALSAVDRESAVHISRMT